MRNPNFLVLDEPTNDLDIVTLQILEEYLQDFPGCVIIVSHDRYFMDKVVDHLLVFKGDGEVKDFPGNYTQYREWCLLEPEGDRIKKVKPSVRDANGANKELSRNKNNAAGRRKMTFNEKMEYTRLEKDIAVLDQERRDIENALSEGTLTVDGITEKSKRLAVIREELDEKEMRWLELAEIEQ